jgi:flagellar motor switch protein FliM
VTAQLQLTDEEVDALLKGVAGQAFDFDESERLKQAAEDFRFGVATERVGELHAFQLLNERLAKGLRAILHPMLRIEPRVSAEAAVIRRLDVLLDSYDGGFLSYSRVRMDPLRGQGLIVLDPGFVGLLVDAFFGGRGQAPARMDSEFTPVEQRIIQRFVGNMVEAASRAWNDVAPLRLELIGSDADPQLAAIVAADESVVLTRFNVQIAGSATRTIDLVYPLQALKPVLGALGARVKAEERADDAAWRDRLLRALLDVSLPVRSVLAEPSISVGDLMSLGAGDVLPIQAPEAVPLLVDRTPFCTGAIGEVNGRVALRVDSLPPAIA